MLAGYLRSASGLSAGKKEIYPHLTRTQPGLTPHAQRKRKSIETNQERFVIRKTFMSGAHKRREKLDEYFIELCFQSEIKANRMFFEPFKRTKTLSQKPNFFGRQFALTGSFFLFKHFHEFPPRCG